MGEYLSLFRLEFSRKLDTFEIHMELTKKTERTCRSKPSCSQFVTPEQKSNTLKW